MRASKQSRTLSVTYSMTFSIHIDNSFIIIIIMIIRIIMESSCTVGTTGGRSLLLRILGVFARLPRGCGVERGELDLIEKTNVVLFGEPGFRVAQLEHDILGD